MSYILIQLYVCVWFTLNVLYELSNVKYVNSLMRSIGTSIGGEV